MDDAISRHAAIDALRRLQTYKLFEGDDMLLVDKAEVQTELMILPSEQPERKKGKWIGKPIAGYCTVHCSVCGETYLENRGKWNYCPNCGCRMEVSEDD